MSSLPPEEQLCDDCFKGVKLEGTPKGSESKIGPFNTYVAKPEQNKNEKAAIVYFYDAFGLRLQNNKLIPDMIAEKTGLTVYVPDLFNGGGIAPDALKMPETAQAAKAQGTLSKIASTGKLMSAFIPFVMKHRPAVHFPAAAEFLKVLKIEKGHEKLGAVGYCYGGKFSVHFNGTGDLTASVACHPSMLNIDDIKAIQKPISFACAESDAQFGDQLRTEAEKTLKAKSGLEAEFVLYANTVHGFAARPNLEIDDVRKGFEGALAQTCRFLSKHLV
ncbi:alpha/beta-hydrolase [Punctularia strigosozonata HHB-11173 SS5]|uniref:alpha/beta-hydrolase n=1 Tax=Punctularia strigosozonata (strain HHB-11173) TaxID=741275 RepID=UPI0004416BB7|nr:alpha/beta-hydrolase [Punctularia strigosozonata HHB-11173 SS5]EIN09724.1 alpha/beta-hydrolase [Punctularia strigosozonata HHB-11173 SS5]